MINPTRMNLITTKRRIAMAKKGYNVLKRKREVLVIEFLRLLKQSKQDRTYLNKLMLNAYRSVTIASAYVGDFELAVNSAARARGGAHRHNPQGSHGRADSQR